MHSLVLAIPPIVDDSGYRPEPSVRYKGSEVDKYHVTFES